MASTTDIAHPAERALSIQHAAEQAGLHPQTVRRRAYDPDDDFPAPIRLSPGRVAILESELLDWLHRRARAVPDPARKCRILKRNNSK